MLACGAKNGVAPAAAACLALLLALPAAAQAPDGGVGETPDGGAGELVGQQELGVDGGAAPEPAADALAGAPIVSIEVLGNRRVPRERIVGAISQAIGDPYDPAKVPQDLRALFALGGFSDVEISVAPAAGGVSYLLRVEEPPVVRELRISGATKISDDELRKASGLVRGEPAGPVQLQQAARAVERLYSERGFALTTAQASSEQAGEGRVDVELRIEERPRVRVCALGFEGVPPERAEKLRGALPLKKASLATRLTGSSTYTPQRLQLALERLESWYFDRGFVDARIDSQVDLSEDRRCATVVFHVFEGEQFRVASVLFQGELVLPEQQLRQLTVIRPGALVDRSRVAADVADLTERLQDLGFACALVVPGIARRPGEPLVDLAFRVEPGEAARVGEIRVSGNTDTRSGVVVRELALEPGDRYSAKAVRLSHERLRALGLFERAEIRVASGCEGGRVDLEVEIAEAKTLGYQLSFGISTDERIVGTLLLVERNLFGTGRALSAQAQYSALRAVAAGAYLEPHLFGSDLDLTLDLSWNRFEYPDFVREAFGGSANLRYPFGRLRVGLEGLTGLFGYSYQDVGVGLETAGLPPEVAAIFRSGNISALALTLVYAARETPGVVPRARQALLGAELSPGFLGASIRYARYSANVRWGFPLPLGLLLRARAGAGLIDPIGPEPVPASERFFLGGIDSLRGYRYRTIAPRLLVPIPDSEPPQEEVISIGGTEQLVLGLELEGPLSRRLRLDGVLFTDAGNVFLNGRPTEAGRDLPLSLFWAAGFGLRWYSPAGVVRFELAFPLTRRAGDPPVIFEIGAGALP